MISSRPFDSLSIIGLQHKLQKPFTGWRDQDIYDFIFEIYGAWLPLGRINARRIWESLSNDLRIPPHKRSKKTKTLILKS